MPISVKHGGGGIDALAGLLQGQGAYATRESQLRGQDMARIYDKQFQDARQSAQLSTQRRGQTIQAGIAAANNATRRAMQSKALTAQRSQQLRQIDAQSARDKQAADTAYKRAAVGAGLQSELQEQAFDQRIQAMEEAARVKSQQTKLQYSMDGKREIAEGNRIIAWANKELAAGNIDQQAHQQLTLKGRAKRDNVSPDVVPDDSKKYKDGRGPDDNWVNPETGDLMGLDNNGLPVVRTPYKNTRAGVAAEADTKRRIEEIKAIQKEADYRRGRIDDEQDRVFTMMQDTDEDDNPVSREAALRKSREVFGDPTQLPDRTGPSVASSFAASGSQAATQTQRTPQAPPALTADGKKAPLPEDWYLDGDWWEHQAMEGVEILQSDMRHPPEIGSAMALIRHMQNKYGYRDEIKNKKIEKKIAEYKERIRRYVAGKNE